MRLTRLLATAALVLASGAGWAQDRVVYHVDTTAQITVVTHAEGVDLLLEGAKAANGTEYAPLVSALKARGVRFEICEITLKNRCLSKDQFVLDADYTPSGVVRIVKLQKSGYAYIKP